MLLVLLKQLFLFLSKMHVACFVEILIVILSKEIGKEKKSHCLYQLKFRCMLHASFFSFFFLCVFEISVLRFFSFVFVCMVTKETCFMFP